MHTSLHASALLARTLTVAAVLGGAALLPASAQTHVYTLNNTFADTNGGPSLVSNGGTLSASGYTFGKNLGLSLANVTNGTDYSITTTFSFSDLTSGNTYKKILDFQNLASDDGLYIYQSTLDFYPVAGASGTTTFAADQSQTVNLTRNGVTQVVTGSVNGVQQFSFIDSSGIAVFNTSGGLINFFEDDNATSGREASGGTVTSIIVSDSAPVPETSTIVSFGLLLAFGFGGALVAARKRKAVA